MINSEKIFKKANDLVISCGTRDTIRIARDIGIKTYYSNELNSLLGMYTYMLKNRVIIINSNLDDIMMRMVFGHEIGHDQLHRDIAKNAMMQEFVLFNIKTNTEYEANAFLSHLIIDNNEILSLSKEGYDVVQIAKMLNTNVNLVLIKLQELNTLGYNTKITLSPENKIFN